ncbi:VOC family protein [Paenactinomyces guangxiensis]|uniref:VOC family protein n=1 Tax=Paenactinomyces guangxiensis TaxID=1490290 RepID=A0A7W1WTC4_9BACL|nr:VOC family protein [Paenactinomyces guangxiensis]MBA4495669.1 VOC family protein [Paenactinomyces guangxiensis]MBH8592657.1 VOC family protein [Paenactinomyces guangxiensis]
MKTTLMHVRANVSNLQRSIEWYEKVLGFKVTGAWPPEKPNYAHFDAEKGAIFSIAEDRRVPSNGRFNFYVSDVDHLWEEIKHKAEIVEELCDTPYGSRKFTIRDLYGNELGFVKE